MVEILTIGVIPSKTDRTYNLSVCLKPVDGNASILSYKNIYPENLALKVMNVIREHLPGVFPEML